MIGIQRTGTIEGVTISAVAHEPLTVTVDGKHAQLAIVTDDGAVVAIGEDVAREARAVSINCYRSFLQGTGRLRVHSKPIERGSG
jgi:hypothetical protein